MKSHTHIFMVQMSAWGKFVIQGLVNVTARSPSTHLYTVHDGCYQGTSITQCQPLSVRVQDRVETPRDLPVHPARSCKYCVISSGSTFTKVSHVSGRDGTEIAPTYLLYVSQTEVCKLTFCFYFLSWCWCIHTC